MNQQAHTLLALCLFFPLTAAYAQMQGSVAPSTTQDISAYTRLIETLEARDGAYARSLGEPLLELGTALRKHRRYADSARVLRRGVHLARVNDGLYSASQIPLLEGEIATYIAASNYTAADERQTYLVQIQQRVLGSSEAYAAALLHHADWQFEAYKRGVGAQPALRLADLYNTYFKTVVDIEQREGTDAEGLALPLQGMLKTAYLMTDEERSEVPNAAQFFAISNPHDIEEERRRREEARRKERNYARGLNILNRLQTLNQTLPPAAENRLTPGQLLTLLGDWHLYHRRPSSAWSAYRAALAELADLEDAQAHRARLFGDPVALPRVADLHTLPAAADREKDVILLEFSVSRRGKPFDIKRLDENPAFDTKAAELKRQLRRTLFRPRFEGGDPVETIQIVRAFDPQ